MAATARQRLVAAARAGLPSSPPAPTASPSGAAARVRAATDTNSTDTLETLPLAVAAAGLRQRGDPHRASLLASRLAGDWAAAGTDTVLAAVLVALADRGLEEDTLAAAVVEALLAVPLGALALLRAAGNANQTGAAVVVARRALPAIVAADASCDAAALQEAVCAAHRALPSHAVLEMLLPPEGAVLGSEPPEAVWRRAVMLAVDVGGDWVAEAQAAVAARLASAVRRLDARECALLHLVALTVQDETSSARAPGAQVVLMRVRRRSGCLSPV